MFRILSCFNVNIQLCELFQPKETWILQSEVVIVTLKCEANSKTLEVNELK